MKKHFTFIMLSLLMMTSTMNYAQDIKKIPFDKGTLKICSYKTLTITGYDGKDVIIKRLADDAKEDLIVLDNLKNRKSKIEKDEKLKLISGSENNDLSKGLKPIARRIAFQIEQIGNELIIKDLVDDVFIMETYEKYEIMIPNSILLKFDTTGCHKSAIFYNSDSSILKNFNGEVEITSHSNSINLIDVSGPVSITTIGGNVTVEFNKILPTHLYSIYSNNGFINIKLSKKSNVSVDATGYEILSDLDFTILSEQTKNEDGQRIKQMNLKLGNGNVRMKLNSGFGNIYLRKQ